MNCEPKNERHMPYKIEPPLHPNCRFYDKGMCNEIKEVK